MRGRQCLNSFLLAVPGKQPIAAFVDVDSRQDHGNQQSHTELKDMESSGTR